MPQTYNPLGFYCPPNGATPDYITYHDFRSWLAYGLLTCWLSHTSDDPNADCNFSRPWTVEDVDELRGHFLDLVETVIVALWKGDYGPGDGEIDGDWQSVCVHPEDDESGQNETMLTWYIRLDDDAMMFELCCTGADSTAIWLGYDAIADRKKVLAALTEARATVSDSKLYDKLVELAK